MIKQNKIFEFDIQSDCPEPFYLQFKRQLHSAIRRHQLPPGSKLPHINKLAAAAGVSVKTAYKGLQELVVSNICVRRPKKGTYVGGSIYERKSNKQKVCYIYHVFPIEEMSQDGIFQQVYAAILEEAAKREINVTFISGDITELLDSYRHDQNIELCGVCLVETMAEEASLRLAELYPELRFVCINYRKFDFDLTPRNIFGIFNDDFGGGFMAGSYLSCDPHIRDIALFTIDMAEDNYLQREKGFRSALTCNGFDLESHLYTCRHPHVDNLLSLRHAGYEQAKKLYQSGKSPDAIFALNDRIIPGIIDFINEQDIKTRPVFFGYDNLVPEISAKYHFSTVAVDYQKMGKLAISIIAGDICCVKSIAVAPQMFIRNNFFPSPGSRQRSEIKKSVYSPLVPSVGDSELINS